jgi:ureidoacrylate peracid hydrolase
MHKTDLPQYAIDGALRRRGKLHQFEEIEPTKSALVVIDMQNAFLQIGSPAEVPVAREIVPNINQLAAAFRSAGGTVAWVQMTQKEDSLVDWSVFYNGVNNPERAGRMIDVLSEGSEGHAIWPELEVLEEDLIVLKDRYSAFLPGASDLAEILQVRDIDTVVITGTLTNVCSESSARDAMMLNFKTIVVSDANAAPTDEEHIAALAALFQVFSDVYATDELIEMIEKTQQSGMVAAE